MAAPAPGKITVTGKIGPALSLTAAVLTNVTAYGVNLMTNVLSVNCDQGNEMKIDINAATTWTCTITNGVQTITIS